MRSPVALCGIAILALLMAGGAAGAQAQQTAQPAAVVSLITEGDGFVAHRAYDKALQSYEKAEKLSHHTCSECLFREVKVYRTLGDFDSALNCAKKAEAQAGDNKTEAARALLLRASLLASTSSKPKDKKLVEAVADTRQALVLEPTQTIAHFNLGVLLMKQEQDAEGIVELKAYIASGDVDPKIAKDAYDDIADPRRAREPYAPDFSFTTLENEQVSLASLRGKVALLDFWGTWCPPCRASIPTMVGLQKDFAKKGVEFVGISSDTDEDAWRKFIAANHMVWPEYRDSDDHVEQTFLVDSFPTYIILDRNGIIRFRQSGFDEQGSGLTIANALDKALKAKPEAPLASASSSATSAPGGNASTAAATTSSANASVQASSAPAAISAYGNPEPVYVHVPAQGQAAGTDANSSSIESKPIFSASVQIITPTRGVDFSGYLVSLIGSVKSHWVSSLPEAAKEGKRNMVIVRFSARRDGKLAMNPAIQSSCGDASLDNAAVAAISAAEPLPQLPVDFSGDTIDLRMFFLYNGSWQDIQTRNASKP